MSKDHPSYLLRLATKEAEKVAAELIRTNPDGLSRGETLTPEQYHFLLKQVADRLRKLGQLPVKISAERFQAFENPFYAVLRSAGLL
jgi:hypothetical protein